MNGYALRLTEDRLQAGGSYPQPLPRTNRVLYVLNGELTVSSDGGKARVSQNSAWYGSGECAVTTGPQGASVLRYELMRAGTPAARVLGSVFKPLLEHLIDLDSKEQYLMRCDRVDFALGGEALPHRHKGGGIRCLIGGTIEVRVGSEPSRMIDQGQAWFESGREPVYAAASRDHPTSFIRCSILPRAIKGQSSIIYVNPEDAERGKPRQYTVFVDEPIELP
jgi:quercetin dioxygenase-like cupin family protein